MAAYEVLLLNTAIPQIQAAQSGDTYLVPRDIAFSTVANLANGTNLLPSLTFSSDTNTGIYREGADALGFTAGGGTNQMVLTSTGLGVGESSPAYKLSVSKASAGDVAQFTNGGASNKSLFVYTDATYAAIATGNNASGNGIAFDAVNNQILFTTNSANRAWLDSSGNLGLGVTPSAKLEIYSTNNAFNALQVRYNGSNDAMGFGIGNSNGFPYLGYNTKSQAFVDAPVYERSNPAAQLRMDNGSFKFNIAPSGTANTTTITNNVSYTIITSGNQTDFGAANNNVGTVFTANASGTLSSGTVSQNISFTQAMTLDASGRLLVGLTADTAAGGYFGIIQAQGSYPAIVLKGTETSAKTWQIGENAGSLAFYNTTDGERARITSGGDLLVGTNAAAVASKLDVLQTTAATAGIGCKATNSNAQCFVAWNSDTSGDNVFAQFYTETSATSRGSITYNRAGGLVAYNTTSDYRAKDIIGPVANAGVTIDALKVYNGKMKGATVERPMLIAHEAQEVTPYAVTGEKDAVNDDGTPKYQQMDVSSLVPLLIAELQSLRARVAQLEAK